MTLVYPPVKWELFCNDPCRGQRMSSKLFKGRGRQTEARRGQGREPQCLPGLQQLGKSDAKQVCAVIPISGQGHGVAHTLYQESNQRARQGDWCLRWTVVPKSPSPVVPYSLEIYPL